MPDIFQNFNAIAVIGIIIGMIGLIIGIVSLVVSVGSRKESQQVIHQNEELKTLLNLEKQNFTWEDIHRACRALAAELRRFNPDYIVTTPCSPMAVTGIVLEELLQWIPVLIINVSAPDIKNSPYQFEPDRHLDFSGVRKKWHVPRELLEKSGSRVAIIDDTCTGTTVYFDRLLELLTETGQFRREQIFTACLITTPHVLQYKILDWHYFTVTKTAYYLPWGKENEEDSKTNRATD